MAESFAEVSNLFKAVDTHKLPAFLPAEEPPKLQVYQVDQKVFNQKKTKSKDEIDIPHKLRKKAAVFLAEPLSHIFN